MLGGNMQFADWAQSYEVIEKERLYRDEVCVCVSVCQCPNASTDSMSGAGVSSLDRWGMVFWGLSAPTVKGYLRGQRSGASGLIQRLYLNEAANKWSSRVNGWGLSWQYKSQKIWVALSHPCEAPHGKNGHVRLQRLRFTIGGLFLLNVKSLGCRTNVDSASRMEMRNKKEDPVVLVIESHRLKAERRQYKQRINKRVNKNQLIIKAWGLLCHRGT